MTNYVRFMAIGTLGAMFVTGCTGGSSMVPTAARASSTAAKASVTVQFAWPTKNVSGAQREVRYISPSAHHITVTDLSGSTNLAASDSTVRIPAGTSSAQIPAFVGYNYWTFTEYASADDTGTPIATANPYLLISDAKTAVTLDVVMNLNSSFMGFSMSSDAVTVSLTSGTYAPPISSAPAAKGTIRVSSQFFAPFTVIFTPLDGFGGSVLGLGSPNIALVSPPANNAFFTVTRTLNPNTSGPLAGQAAYRFTAVPMDAAFTPGAIQVWSIDSAGLRTNIGTLNLTLSAA